MAPEIRADTAVLPEVPRRSSDSRAREGSRALGCVPVQRTYGLDVPADPRARLVAFAAFVKRATDHAKLSRGWSIEQIAERAGISANTVYLWKTGKGTSFPQGANVEAFCDALGIKPEVAFALLWPGSHAPATEPVPLNSEPDLMVLARRLADPNVPEREKFLIREVVQGLAARSGGSVGAEDTPKRRDAV